jgi:glucose-6-phosphate isomerase
MVSYKLKPLSYKLFMKLEFYNCPEPEKVGSVTLPEKPEFVSYVPDFELLEKYEKEFGKYENVIVIAHGGSISPFMGIHGALKYQAKKNVYFLSTVDPDYIFDLKKQLKPENTLVLSISKSGENTTQLEETMPFSNYPVVVVTGKSSPLRAIAEKMKWQVIIHPPIGGRYTGLTEVNLLAAAIAGIDVRGLFEGGKKWFEQYDTDNLAFRAASVFWQLEQKGYVDVFMPTYSHYLFPMSAIIVQLCHESFGKNGKGQTFLSAEAPESQHHTNQRFFGGTKNIAGFFIGSESFLHPTVNIFPTQVHSVQMKSHVLFDIDKIPLEKSMEFELNGTMEDARINSIPLAHLSIAGFSPQEIGAFMAFWELFAVYSSVLRGVDPFDQPQVENSKKISFNKRLAYKGLL